jgi:hypothetical protein
MKTSKQLKKRSGSGMLALSIALCFITTAIGFSSAKLASIIFGNVHSNGITVQANEYAMDKAEELRSTAYSALEGEIRHGINARGYFEQVTVEPEKVIASSGVRQKNITINVYYRSELSPRATLYLKRSNWNNMGCPIGSILAWPSNSTPGDGGVWLTCNGSAIPSKYSTLRDLVGNNTPDFRGKFLRGYGSVNSSNASGNLLAVQMDSDPRLTGSFFTYAPQYVAHMYTTGSPWNSGYFNLDNTCPTYGPFSGDKTHMLVYDTKFDRGKTSENHTYIYRIFLDNSLRLYGKTSSETRPINVAVNFIIKAE